MFGKSENSLKSDFASKSKLTALSCCWSSFVNAEPTFSAIFSAEDM